MRYGDPIAIPARSAHQESGLQIANQVMSAIRTATMGRIQGLAVESTADSLVLTGSCDAFYVRKEAIESAKRRLAKAEIGEKSLIDRIQVVNHQQSWRR